jgi:hypothetical protein
MHRRGHSGHWSLRYLPDPSVMVHDAIDAGHSEIFYLAAGPVDIDPIHRRRLSQTEVNPGIIG